MIREGKEFGTGLKLIVRYEMERGVRNSGSTRRNPVELGIL
jgi:hypothetical protein